MSATGGDRVSVPVLGWVSRWAGTTDQAVTRLAAAIVLVSGVVVTMLTVRMVILSWDALPYWDQWDNLVSGRKVTLAWLTSQHTQHRILLPRLVFLLDYAVSAETNVVDFVANLLSQTTLAVLLAWIVLRGEPPDRSVRAWVIGLCLVFSFSAIQAENFTWGFQIQFFVVVLGAFVTFAIVALGPSTVFAAAAAVLAGGATVYTLSSGLIVPPLALALGIWVRRPHVYLFILLLGAIGLPILFLTGFLNSHDPGWAFANATSILGHFLAQIGSPFSNGSRLELRIPLAITIGVIGLIFFFANLHFAVRSASTSQKVLIALCIFSLGAAALTAVGRADLGIGQAFSSRYTTPVLIFWLSAILLLFSISAANQRIRTLIMAATVPLAIFAVLWEPHFARQFLSVASARDQAIPAVLTGVPDARLLAIYPNVSKPLQRRQILLAAHTSVFADAWARQMGGVFSEHFSVDGLARCGGRLTKVQPIVSDNKSLGLSLTGIAWSDASSWVPRRLVFTNSTGTIVGYGRAGFGAAAVGQSASPQSPSGATWWVGDVVLTDLAGLKTYALIGSGSSACSFDLGPAPAGAQ